MPTDSLYHLWNLGQQHLAAGRYVAARHYLQSAEAVAWRARDAQSLARLYLPLLETRRQIRYHAVEGTLLILAPTASPRDQRRNLAHFLTQNAGTLLLPVSPQSARHARTVQHAAHHNNRFLETLLLVPHRAQTRLVSPADPAFAAGLPVHFTLNADLQVGNATDPHLTIPLPPPGIYTDSTHPRPHAQARESLLAAWECLALRWQHRHPARTASPMPARTCESAWTEMAALRQALEVDPACEPISMRLISLAEGIERL